MSSDAAAELAVQDAIEKLNAEFPDQLQMFYALVGRRPADVPNPLLPGGEE
jgi:hypothetical protein